jgi:hypothetical protein
LISIMFTSLVGITSFALILEMVRLIVPIGALIKIGTSLLLATISRGTSLVTTLRGRCRWSRCMPLVDLDCGSLQIGLDSIECRGLAELI